MKIIILSVLLVLNLTFYLNANEIVCKKFDITCKAKKYIDDTKEFQKKKWNDPLSKKSETKK